MLKKKYVTFVLLAGTIFGLVACDQKKTGAVIPGPENLGFTPNFGDDATDAVSVDDNRFQNFAILYFRFEANGEMVSKYAIFDGSGTKAEIDNLAAKLIKKRFAKNLLQDGDWSDNDIANKGPLPIPHTGGKKVPVSDFLNGNFLFGKPMRIYVYLDNPGLKFNSTWPILFTPYGSADRNEIDPKKWTKMQENRSFYNAAVGSVSGLPKDQILYFENHYNNAEGKAMEPNEKPSDDPKFKPRYSINFNFEMKVRNSNISIPMVIDPDTGNGYGSPPPVRG